MIQQTTPPPPAPGVTFDSLAQSIEGFIGGVITLNPEQAAIRAGLTLLVVIGAMLLIWGLRVLFKAMVERVAPDGEDGAPAKKRLPVGRWSLRIARLAIFVVALLAVLRVWGFEFDDLRDGPLGAVFSVASRIAIILVLSFAAIELAQLGIMRMFTRVAARARTPRRAAQVRTLAPLLAGVVTTILVVIATMMTLSEVGVEIGPLIAGAGIIGLAVGFGAQTLVKDFLTGIFLILEDIVSVGDVVMIQDFGGVVEEMSLRTIKLRDFDGTLHIFPYSEAQVIHNRTKNFSFAVFEFNVDYSADLHKAIALMHEVGEAVKADPAFAPFILDQVEIIGVDKLTDAGVLLKGRMKTAPGKQWAVKRAYLLRIKDAFDKGGIATPITGIRIVPEDPGA